MVETNPAAGGLVDIAYVAESEYGSTPASATFTRYPNKRTTLNLTKENFRSEIRSSDRQRQHSRHGYRNVGGDLMSELASQWHDDFFQALLGGSWATGVVEGPHATVSVTASKITLASATFITTALKVGDIFTLAAQSAANAGTRHQIASLSETEIEVCGSTLTATTDTSATIAVVGQKLTVGNTLRSFSIERYFSNLGLYQNFKGCRVNSARFSMPPSGISELDFGVVGQDADNLSSTSIASVYATAPTTEPITALIGQLYEGSTLTELGLITGFEFSATNAMTGDKVAFRNTVPTVNFGRFMDITGTMTVLFNSATLFNKFLNETETTIDLTLYDGSDTDTANFIRIRMERVKFNTGDIDDSAEVSIPMTIGFESLKPDGDTGRETTSLTIQRSNV